MAKKQVKKQVKKSKSQKKKVPKVVETPKSETKVITETSRRFKTNVGLILAILVVIIIIGIIHKYAPKFSVLGSSTATPVSQSTDIGGTLDSTSEVSSEGGTSVMFYIGLGFVFLVIVFIGGWRVIKGRFPWTQEEKEKVEKETKKVEKETNKALSKEKKKFKAVVGELNKRQEEKEKESSKTEE